MKHQAFNPYLPSWEYIPDGEPYLIGDRVYVFGSHDRFGGTYFCLGDYVAWSAPQDDLSDWRCEGVIYRKEQDPLFNEKDNVLFAPDVVQGKDGRWYLFYTLASNGIMSVAVSDCPAGKYTYHGAVRAPDGHIIGTQKGDVFNFDPGILSDGGHIYLYTGFSPRPGPGFDALMQGRRGEGSYCFELEDDMLTVKGEPSLIASGPCRAEGTSFAEHPFFEASSIRKIGKTYYFIYSSIYGHELCYATSDCPTGGFTFRGVLVSNGDVGYHGRTYEQALAFMGNNHGSLLQTGGKWYIFYHRHTNRSSYSRQACAEEIVLREDGLFEQAEMTSCGLNGGDLKGEGLYPAYIACNLKGPSGTCFSEAAGDDAPYITQDGGDREGGEKGYIANIRRGSMIGTKYYDTHSTLSISVFTRGAGGRLVVSDGEHTLAELELSASQTWQESVAAFSGGHARCALYFLYEGQGAIDLGAFALK